MKLLLATLLLCFSALTQAAETRFDSIYFFQSQKQLEQKGINVDSFGRYTRALQTQIYRALKKVKMPESAGYLVVAIRSDGAVTSWLDMAPAVHEYYDNQIYEIVQKLPPVDVTSGILVFGIKMAIDTAVHTKKAVPAPADWADAKKKISDPNNIEELVLSIWPEQ
ncbi:hypothetical protein H8L32_25235 [Undibacterium sp. CY18W]|uniref:DUF4136 domain-containing protein n=1 Tax=Undibacterium hunanense TaxID=2762292 RepID=A0ABR6ZY49_9BURK|nr:hypothetical protein [Undibacterium hunanense]MBC3920795.1 hypothetical protein [Undibacterium hunanense]